MEQRVEGERDDNKCVYEEELLLTIYKRRGAAKRPHAAMHGGAPTSSLIMWVEAPLTPTHAPLISHLEIPRVFLY